MSTTQVDTSKAGISDPNSVQVLSRWTLRFDGGFLVIAGSAALLADLAGHSSVAAAWLELAPRASVHARANSTEQEIVNQECPQS